MRIMYGTKCDTRCLEWDTSICKKKREKFPFLFFITKNCELLRVQNALRTTRRMLSNHQNYFNYDWTASSHGVLKRSVIIKKLTNLVSNQLRIH